MVPREDLEPLKRSLWSAIKEEYLIRQNLQKHLKKTQHATHQSFRVYPNATTPKPFGGPGGRSRFVSSGIFPNRSLNVPNLIFKVASSVLVFFENRSMNLDSTLFILKQLFYGEPPLSGGSWLWPWPWPWPWQKMVQKAHGECLTKGRSDAKRFVRGEKNFVGR